MILKAAVKIEAALINLEFDFNHRINECFWGKV